jgi:hypothetical protein
MGFNSGLKGLNTTARRDMGNGHPGVHDADEGKLPASLLRRLIQQKPWCPINGSLGRVPQPFCAFSKTE